jgi:C1A family cysteine protease
MNRKIKRYGWIPDLPDHRDHLYAAPQPVLAKLPKTIDLRAKCPPVFNQGELGSCTANAIAAAHQFDQLKQKKPKAFTPSRLFIYYNERVMEGTVREDSGAMIRDGIKTLVKQGAAPETAWPYVIKKFATKPPKKCYARA